MVLTEIGRASGTRGKRPAGRPWNLYAIAVVLAWAVPIGVHLLRGDLALIPVIVLATASVIRTGGTITDRLMLAVFLDCGAAVVAGIGFTFWPWGLNPVPVTGCALTGLIGYAALARVRPSLPLRGSGADLVVPGVWGAGAYIALAPTFGKSAADRIAYTLIDNDRLHHYSLFDAIRTVGGYSMLKFEPVRHQVADGMGRNYPPATHYLYALIDSFFMSGRPAGESLDTVDRYYVYVSIGFGFLAASVAWGAKWVAGPAVRGWRATLVTSAAGTLAATGFLSTLIWEGFDSEVVGLAFLALTMAVLLRPPAGVLTQVVFVAFGIVAVSFSYTLMLGPVAVGLVVVVIARRRALRPRLLPVLAIGAATTVLALIPVVMPHLNSGFSDTGTFLYGGFVVRVPRRTLYTIIVIAFAAVAVSPRARRSPVIRLTAITLAGCILLALALWKYTYANIATGGTYYFEKSIHALFVVALVCLGSAAHLVGRDIFAEKRRALAGASAAGLPTRAGAVVASVAVAAAGVFLAGGVSVGKMVFDRDLLTPGADTTWAKVWSDGTVYTAPYGPTVERFREDGIINSAGGKATMVVVDADGGVNQSLSLITSTLNRNLGDVVRQEEEWNVTANLVGLPAKGDLPAKSQTALKALQDIVQSAPFPMKIVAKDDRLISILRQFSADNPRLQLEVIKYNG